MFKHLACCKGILGMLMPAFLIIFLMPGSPKAVSTTQTWSTYDLEYTTSDTFDLVVIEDCYLMDSVGKPALPVKYVNLLLPTGNNATSLSISRTTTRLDSVLNIVPAQVPIKLCDCDDTTWSWTDPDTSVYNSANPYPSVSAEIVSQGYFDGKNKIVTIAIYPLIYYPSIDSLDLVTSINVTVNYSGGSAGSQPTYRQPNIQQMYDRTLRAIVENDDDIFSYQETPTLVDTSLVDTTPPGPSFYPYTIITQDSLVGYFDDLVDWLTRRGFEAGVVTWDDIVSDYPNGDEISGIDDDAGSVRQFLYEGFRIRAINCALLGGLSAEDTTAAPDIFNCPVRYGYWSCIPSDFYFAEFDNDWWDGTFPVRYGKGTDIRDFQQEIWVGRIPAINGEDIENWIAKLLTYEQNPGCGDYGHLLQAYFAESDEMQEGAEAEGVYACFNDNIFDSTIVREVCESGAPDCNCDYLPFNPTSEEVVSDLSTIKPGYISFKGHGAPQHATIASKGYNESPKNYIESADANTAEISGDGLDNVVNTDYYPFFYNIGCSCGAYDKAYFVSLWRSMAETFLFIPDSSGGPASVACTRSGFVTSSSNKEEKFVEALFDDSCFAGSMHAASTANYQSHYLTHSHNLFGSPTTPI